jgi:hypothetical protein
MPVRVKKMRFFKKLDASFRSSGSENAIAVPSFSLAVGAKTFYRTAAFPPAHMAIVGKNWRM